MREVKKEDLYLLWSKLGISSGDTIMCHSFLAKLGKVTPSYDIVIDTLIEVIGQEGTLIFPVFTYSYFDKLAYDVQNSPSKVGLLGEIARKREDSVRSLDPCFSMVALGKNAKKFMERNSKNTFGKGSIYDTLLKKNVKIVLLGVNFTALSLFMHLEKLLNVPYRYEKTFAGTTIDHGQMFSDEIIHFVRDESYGFINNREWIGKILESDFRCQKHFLGYSEHFCMQSHVIWEIVEREYSVNQNCLINKLN